MTFPPQPTRPLKPADVVKRRPITASGGPISAFPSSSAMGLTTLGPPPKKVLTIVSWNVQKYEESKAIRNAYVNVVINRILDELKADICLLLESRENNSVNLAAIEHRLANPSTYKEDESSEEAWDARELETEAADVLRNSESVASMVSTYEMLSTELTGKRYKPPFRIYLYDSGKNEKFFPSMSKAFSINPRSPKHNPVYSGEWKRFYLGSDVLRAYYEPTYIDTSAAIADLALVPLNDVAESNVMFRLKSCAACGERLGISVDCAACQDWNPYSTAADNLRNEIKECAFSLGGVDLETYAILASGQPQGSFDGVIQMCDKAAQAYRYRTGLLRHTVPPLAPYTPQERCAAYLFGRGHLATSTEDQKWHLMAADLDARGIDADQFAESAMFDALGIDKRVTPPPVPRDDGSRWAEFLTKLQPDWNPEYVLNHEVAKKRIDPTPLTLGQKLDIVGIANSVVQPERDMSHEERRQVFTQRYPGKAVGDVLAQNGVHPKAVAFNAGLDRIKFPTIAPQGPKLPYLDPSASTYGRSPFILSMSATLSTETTAIDFPVVGFHAPFGDDNAKGMQIRVDAVLQMLDADAGEKRRLGDHDNAIIIGDLNLDPTESLGNMKGAAAGRAYAGLLAAGFEPAIPKVPSSLTTVFNSKKKTSSDGPYKRFEDVPYQKLSGDVTSFTSSAYDNVLVRGQKLQSKIVTAAVVDVVGWIQDEIAQGTVDPAGAAHDWPGFTNLTPLQQAFFIYRNYVSDHLPVVVDIEVEPLKPEFYKLQHDLSLYRRIRDQRDRIRVHRLAYTNCAHVDTWPAVALLTLEGAKADFHIAVVTSLAPTYMNVETADGPLQLPLPKSPQGMIVPDLPVAIVHVKGDKPYVHLAIGLSEPREAMTVIEPQGRSALVFLMGKIMRISSDGKKMRVAVDRYRCVLPVSDNCSLPPKVGGYAMALLEGCREEQINMVV
jgi:hypothetical protein